VCKYNADRLYVSNSAVLSVTNDKRELWRTNRSHGLTAEYMFFIINTALV